MKATKIAILVLGAMLVSPELVNSLLFAQHEQHTQPQAPPAAPREGPAPAKPSAPPLSLEELEQMALANNPTLRQASAEIRAASGRARQAGLWPNPTVGYMGEEIRGGRSRGGQQGFFIEQPIILGGKLGLSRKVFGQEKVQAEAESEEQRLRVINAVRLLYFRALAAQQTVELHQNLRRLAADAAETSHQLFNAGQADQPDVLQAEVELEQNELALIEARNRQQQVWQGLAAVVGKPQLPLTPLAGNLEENLPELDAEKLLDDLLQKSPAVKIAQAGVTRAELALSRARREPIPDLRLRAGLQQNRELIEPTGRPVGLQGFAEVGVQIPIFNRNQGNVEAAKADLERSQQELLRVALVLRERFAGFFRNYADARIAVARYRTAMLPRAEKAYQLYLARHREMGAAYPQVLIAQRTLFQLQTDYISALENLWTNSVALQGFLLTDGLEAPSRPGDLDRPVRELNVPMGMGTAREER